MLEIKNNKVKGWAHTDKSLTIPIIAVVLMMLVGLNK